ncbi:ComEC/Rec2 family competence protein [Kitasatospora sp. NPDC096147]|uniref:ComEC/Rec2 family competence protein n=1 Tax=Kitasatospora sp. NPDC096147 TaxID=3364093 RepID=UPI003812867B
MTAAAGSASPAAPEPPDLRLLLPTAVVWAVTATVLGLGARERPYLIGGALLLAVAALLALRGVRRAGALVAAVLLAAGTAAAVTTLHTADLQRGPIPELARAAAAPPPADAPSVPAAPTAGPVPDPSRPSASAGPSSPAVPAGPSAPPVLTTVELTVTGDPEPRSSHTRGTTPGQALLVVEATVDRADGIRTHTPVTLIVRAQDTGAWGEVVPSTRLRTRARVLPPAEEYRSTAAALVVQGAPHLLAGPSAAQRAAARLRAGLRDASDHLPADPRGLLPGLVVGDTTRLPSEVADAFRATDLGHLTAVSGANLAIVLAVLTGASARASTAGRGGLAGLLGLPLRTTALLGAVLTVAFVTVCRPEPSVLRAAATGLVGLLALALGRPRQALPALAGAVLVLLLVDPYLARSFGFLFSVLATTGLLTLGPRWTAALRARGWPEWLAGAVGATAAAQALCAPATILLAPRISLVAVPCNLLAEAAVAPATLLGFATLAVAPLSLPAARLLADLAAVPTGWLVAVARHGAALPGAQLDWPAGLFGCALLALATLALVWAARPFGRRSRPRTLLAAVLLPALLIALLRPPPLVRLATGWPPEGWRLVMCDIGQGDMTVLPVPGRPGSAVVVDTGPDPAAADRCLRQLDITEVPLLILSHYHADHVEGLPGVLHGRAVGALQVTTLDQPPGERSRVLAWAAAEQVPVLPARQDERRTAGPGLSWQVLWPADPLGPSTPGANNASIALLVTAGEPPDALRIALLGDLEPPAQAALRARAGLPRVDVLKVAHHGSAHQDRELTAALRPRLALISCGEGNPYGHPSARTVAELTALGATVLRTDRAGAIAVLGTPATLHAVTRRAVSTPVGHGG